MPKTDSQLSPSKKFQIQINDFGGSTLRDRGVRYQDHLLIRPVQGKSRKIVLNRTTYDLLSSEDYRCLQQNYQIFLPGILEKDFHYSLTLCPIGDRGTVDNSGRYFLKSLSGQPFKINGSLVFESFVERGDRVNLAYNVLDFIEGKEEKVFEDDELNINEKLIQSDMNILIEGETGTGKSYLAKKIHEESGRLGPFVHINLSSFSKGLIESELFGHVKGAFTGATHNKSGAFLDAHRGTLFLDEIDSLPLEIQTKLLLFLDSKKFRPVGSNREEKADTRLIFASGRRLGDLVSQNIMRSDFYFRLNSGALLTIPPLREVPQKIEKLSHEFSREKEIVISPGLIDYYKTLPWPGNIRQLMAHLNKKFVLTKGKKLVFDKVDEDLLSQKNFSPRGPLKEDKDILPLDLYKSRYAYRVFLRFDGNVTRGAAILGITRNTFRSLVNKYKNHLNEGTEQKFGS